MKWKPAEDADLMAAMEHVKSEMGPRRHYRPESDWWDRVAEMRATDQFPRRSRDACRNRSRQLSILRAARAEAEAMTVGKSIDPKPSEPTPIEEILAIIRRMERSLRELREEFRS